jgi:hypothetical protein
MLDGIDNILRQLFVTQVPNITSPLQVRFQPPDDDWRTYVSTMNQVALNVYLIELKENRMMRSNGCIREVVNNIVNEQPWSPLHAQNRSPHPLARYVDVSYLITAWDPAIAGPAVEPTIVEHELLWNVTAALMAADPLTPSKIYAPSPVPDSIPAFLEIAELQTTILPLEGFGKHAEFWGTMPGSNHPWRPAVLLIVTLPVMAPVISSVPTVTTRITESRVPTGVEMWAGKVGDVNTPPPTRGASVAIANASGVQLAATGHPSGCRNMKDVSVADCLTGVKLQRVNYFDRQLLTADDMLTEREYFLQKLRRHNRFLHGWGVVCGLAVKSAATSDQPWRVEIDPGYALGPYGDEIFVGETSYLDLARCGPNVATDPPEPNRLTGGTGTTGSTVYVAIKYAECSAPPVLALSGCGDEAPCEFSRICDSFEVSCLSGLPATPPSVPSLCEIMQRGVVMPCPPCPQDPWVVLAKVTPPAAATTKLEQKDIDEKVRRIVFSTAVLQGQLTQWRGGEQSRPGPGNVHLIGLGVRPSGSTDDFGPNATLSLFRSPEWEFQLTLSGPAPTGGFVVKLSSNHRNMTLHQALSVTVPAGQTLSASLPPVPTTPVTNAGGTVVKVTATGTTGPGTATAELLFGGR